jgi:Pyridine nucleotide-disulphide oxidoreductase
MRHDYGIVFCGGGPAAIGPIVCAAVEGRLGALLDSGVCVIERGARIGPGSIGHYPISANTRGTTFLRCLAAPQLAHVRDDSATRALERLRYVFPRLPLVGAHLDALGAAVHAVLDAHPRCSVLTGHTVEELRALSGGGVAIQTDAVELTADRAVIAMGGRPRPIPYAGPRTCHADLLLDDRKGLPETLERGIAETGKAVVVGSSHSAWSAAWLLLRHPARPRVTVLHRAPPRFFYWSVQAARNAGYEFHERDVCQRTGRVNRHGGLRADAHALAREALAKGAPVEVVALRNEREAQRALEEAGAIVAGVGYISNLPRIHGEPRPGELLAYGLGAGVPARGVLAGEPSYTGPIDSVGVYQAEVGRMVLDALLLGKRGGGVRSHRGVQAPRE